MRLPGALGAELHQVVVALHVGDQAQDLEHFGALGELRGVQAHGCDQQVDPLLRREVAPGVGVLLEGEPGQLDRLQARDVPRGGLGALQGGEVRHVGHAPHTTGEQAVVVADSLVGDQGVGHPEVLEGRHVAVVRLVQGNGDLVDDPVTALLAYPGFDEF